MWQSLLIGLKWKKSRNCQVKRQILFLCHNQSHTKESFLFFKPCNTKNRSGPKNSTVKILPWTMTWAITSTCGPEIVANFYTYKSPFPFSLYLVFSWGWCILVWMLAKCNHVFHTIVIYQRDLSGIFSEYTRQISILFTSTRYPGYQLFAQTSFFLPFSILSVTIHRFDQNIIKWI